MLFSARIAVTPFLTLVCGGGMRRVNLMCVLKFERYFKPSCMPP
jgi:hypothetical protein